MSFNKKILAVAIVGGLFATSAQAQVVISNPTPVPVAYTNAIVASPTAPAALADIVNTNDLRSALGYAFSNGEVRYARFECNNNMKFTSATATFVQGASANGTATLGAVNGIGTSAISFSITATDANVTTDDLFNVSGAYTVESTSPVSCTYGLYDQPSQASAGGTAGRIASATGNFLSFVNSFAFTATNKTATANVETAAPGVAFGEFVASGNTAGLNADLSSLSYGLTATPGLKADGTGSVTLADLMATGATGTRIVVNGDFSIAANAAAPLYTGAALSRVFISAGDNCTLAGGTPASSLTATTATFEVGSTAVVGPRNLCITNRTNTVAIPAAQYTAALTAVSATPATYTVSSVAAVNSGEIVRNGTTLQAPLAQVPDGYLSRLVLTNTGTVDRPFTISVSGEIGNTITSTNLTGTVPAGGTMVRDLTTVLTGFTSSRRATLNVNIAGPSNQIQGLYQIVFPSTGALSNHVLVRPNTN